MAHSLWEPDYLNQNLETQRGSSPQRKKERRRGSWAAASKLLSSEFTICIQAGPQKTNRLASNI